MFDFKGQVLSPFRLFDSQVNGYQIRRQLETETETAIALGGMLEITNCANNSRLSREELTGYLDELASAVQGQVTIALSSSGQGLDELPENNGDDHLSAQIQQLENWPNLRQPKGIRIVRTVRPRRWLTEAVRRK